MLMQTLTGLAIGSLLWFAIGFTLTFGPSQGGLIGNLNHVFLLDVGIDCCYPLSTATSLPGILFAGFQMMFALMVPVIVTGAWAERMEFKAFAWFTLVWPFLVYYPLAHWIWNMNGWLAAYGVLDFAGGLTIHTSTGVAALVVSSILAGRMKGHTSIGKKRRKRISKKTQHQPLLALKNVDTYSIYLIYLLISFFFSLLLLLRLLFLLL